MARAETAPPDLFRGGLVGMYALSLMDRDGPTHGYRISESISERTEGAWRPGPGAIYPTLQRLVTRGYARSKTVGPRKIYEITPAGRTLLKRMRGPRARLARNRPDYGLLWAEVIGVQDVGEFLQRRLERSLEGIERHLRRTSTERAAARRLALSVGAELRSAANRLELLAPPATAPRHAERG
jgi:DNA-binding PadR family transcriptional regulator